MAVKMLEHIPSVGFGWVRSVIHHVACATPRLRNLAADEDGGPLVEFTVILPLMLALTFGMIQWGVILYAVNNMYSAAREGARLAAVGQCTTPTDCQTEVQSKLVTWIQPTASVTCDPVSLEVSCTVSVARNQAGIINFLPMTGAFKAAAFMRKEAL